MYANFPLSQLHRRPWRLSQQCFSHPESLSTDTLWSLGSQRGVTLHMFLSFTCSHGAKYRDPFSFDEQSAASNCRHSYYLWTPPPTCLPTTMDEKHYNASKAAKSSFLAMTSLSKNWLMSSKVLQNTGFHSNHLFPMLWMHRRRYRL